MHHKSMRELLYVSDSKLQRFDLSQAPRRRRPRLRMESRLSVPGVGSVTISPADQAAAEVSLLQQVVTAIESSERAPVPIDAPGITAGQWVTVTRTFSYAALLRAAVFFLDRDPTPDVLDQGQLRVLLHGSFHHLRAAYQGTDSVLLLVAAGASGHNIYDIIRVFARSCGPDGEFDAQQALEEIEDAFVSPARRRRPTDWLDVSRFVSQLESLMPPPETFAVMSSLARVTAIVPYYKRTAPTEAPWDTDGLERSGELVIASPLFVAYAAAPATSVAVMEPRRHRA